MTAAGEGDHTLRSAEGVAGAASDEATSPVEEAARAVRDAIGEPVPRVAVVLGSGLGGLADRFEGTARVATAGIPGWPESTVEGHAGELLAGDLGGGRTLGLSGRVHMYEGHDPRSVGFPVRVLARLGVEVLVLSNAAGAIDVRLAPGDLMLIADHIDLMGRSPLRGPPAPDEVRHADPRDAYDPVLRSRLRRAAREVGVGLREGVYAATLGPSYETPAEIEMLDRMGADAVGMSTVPEVLTARALGLRCVAVSCLTNYAAGVGPEPLDHADVLETAERVADTFQELVIRGLERIRAPEGT